METPATAESPLVRMERGPLRPKAVTLYETLLQPSLGGDYTHDDNYWAEFFLLPCVPTALLTSLEVPPEELLQKKNITHELFENGLRYLASSNISIVDNALIILSVFFRSVFSKSFLSYSSDVISVIAGLETIDKKFTSFLQSISRIISDCPALSIRVTAIRTVTVVAGGVYQTSLSSYFFNKNLFVPTVKFIASPDAQLYVGDAFTLIGILASYDKQEGLNPYQVRCADFVDNAAMVRIIQASGYAWKISLDKYTSPTFRPQNQETLLSSSVSLPLAIGSSVAGWVSSYFPGSRPSSAASLSGPGSSTSIELTSATPFPDDIPHPTISIMLSVYEFVYANRVFARLLAETPGAKLDPPPGAPQEMATPPPPISLFISLCSFLLQNQHKTLRSVSYSRLALIVLRLLVEDANLLSKQLSSASLATHITIPRHRNPPLPHTAGKVSLLHGILDTIQGCLRYNMKRNIDHDMYNLALTVQFQLIASLRSAKVRLSYHWPEVWRSIISVIKFLNSHPPTSDPGPANETASLTCLILSTLLIHGETILPDTTQYDSLFYTIVESSSDFTKLKSVYGLTRSASMAVIEATTNHYAELLKPALNNSLSSDQVSQIIKQGYQTLSLFQFATESSVNEPTKKNLLYDPLPKYKELDERLFLKRLTRLVISDTQSLYH